VRLDIVLSKSFDMAVLTQVFQRRMCCWVKNPRQSITYAWMLSIVLILIAFIVACVAANKLTQIDSGIARAAGFGAMFTSLVLVILAFAGSLIMRKNQTAMAIGSFLGVVFIACQQMLIIFALFVEESQVTTQISSDKSTYRAMAAFCFLLFLVYATFGILLAVFRDDIIKYEEPYMMYRPAGDVGGPGHYDGEPFEDIPTEDDDNQL
jgi:uncharacterized protein YacL